MDFVHGGRVLSYGVRATLLSRERKVPADFHSFATELLGWYRRHARSLPWRLPPGSAAPPDPYAVWLSEIMLQQTTVAAAGPYFSRFLARWPSVRDLAAAPREDVLAAWAGLGYYSRARNLHAAARHVAEAFGGVFPSTEEGLRALPGVGPYTAAAIAAIAFGERAAVVDANVERVAARLFAVETPLPAAKPEIREKVGLLTPAAAPGDFAQAMMDLGALVCSPKRPQCAACPVAAYCEGRARGIAESLPRFAPKKARATRRAVAFLCLRSDGAVLLRRRPDKGLLGGMLEVPSSPWAEGALDLEAALAHAPLRARWRARAGLVTHTFTHFRLELAVYEGRPGASAIGEADGLWVAPSDLATVGLPTVMRKVTALVEPAPGPLFAAGSAGR
ncbi:MAG: A/G-specific adenine glycosylase [Alphaproteobacteria bacterium]|nr:A/G-specific adenine glycosylase [Alphaproteobacteria bacterium]